jgi:hypothetical protein
MKRPTNPIIVIMQTIMLLGTAPFVPMANGAPSVTITSPADGDISLSSTVNLTGHASGSDDRWFQTSEADFNSSVFEETTNANGTVDLNRTRMPIYDDFDDNNLDSNRWNMNQTIGINITEDESQLRINGTGAFPGYRMNITSTQTVPTVASFDLNALSGKGYLLSFRLFKDSNNYTGFEIQDRSNLTDQIRIVNCVVFRGIMENSYWDILPIGPNNFRLVMVNNTVIFYINEVDVASAFMLPMISRIQIDIIINGTGGWIDSYWDNASWGYLYSESGNFTSSICDTGAIDPVLKSVRWNASVPNATDLKIQVRSSDNPDISNPTAWAPVTNGQNSSFPAVKRYLQYRATLASLDSLATPSLKDIEIVYSKPVAKVEISIDNNATWIPAHGTESWSVGLQLPEDTNILWVKVTDVAGETAVESRRIEVDTTPPTSSVIIDDGAPFTVNHTVRLSLNSTDDYGVVSMIVSEDPAFTGASWVYYAPVSRPRLSVGDGLKTVYAKFRDANGWESEPCNDSIIVDTQPPIGSVLIDSNAMYTRNATVTLSVEASDPIGVTAMQVCNTADFAGARWIDYSRSLGWSLIAGSGERTVFARFKDAGGLVSQPVNDTILADLVAPSVSLAINGGVAFTRYSNVTVELAPTENYQSSLMQVREGNTSFPPDLEWAPYQPSVGLVLTQGDGYKTVSGRLMDIAGNSGPADYARIILDTTAPMTKLDEFPETSYNPAINISWDAIEAFSGVLWYDVQYRTGNGGWTDLLTHTCSTSVVFKGEDAKTYSFRVRAQDRAGNLEDFPATAERAVTIRLARGAPTITTPAQNATIGGKVRIMGECRPDSEEIMPVWVLVRVDDAPWQPAEGTVNWSFYLDTTKLTDGNHVIRAKSFDGSQYSTETELTIKVNNGDVTGFALMPVLIIVLIIALIIICILVVIIITRHHRW